MNIYDPYPETVELDGRIYRLNLAYDRVLRVLDAEEMAELTAEDRIAYQAALLLERERDLPRSTQDQARLIAAALALLPKPDAENKNAERYIDFHQDAALIRSAFFRIGVDLLRDKIHICQFLELLADLPEDTALMRTIDIRRRPLPEPNKHNQKQIAELQAAKARVAIRYSEQERRQRFADSLKNSSVLRG